MSERDEIERAVLAERERCANVAASTKYRAHNLPIRGRSHPQPMNLKRLFDRTVVFGIVGLVGYGILKWIAG